jgi:hypothetical protein
VVLYVQNKRERQTKNTKKETTKGEKTMTRGIGLRPEIEIFFQEIIARG